MRAASLIACLFIATLTLIGCGEPKKYPIGKDTVASFGDGTWEICKTGGGDSPRKLHLFCNENESDSLVRNIAAWRQEGDWVYLVGEDGVFAVVNFRTNFMGRYVSIDAAPEKYRGELHKLGNK